MILSAIYGLLFVILSDHSFVASAPFEAKLSRAACRCSHNACGYLFGEVGDGFAEMSKTDQCSQPVREAAAGRT